MDNVYNDDPIHAAANHLALKIKDRLASGQRVVWLLSGGSGIQAVLATCTLLAGSDLRNLYVTLSDERYGPVGHPDENWQQLLDGGMQLPSANLYRPLTGDDIVTTCDTFGAWIMQQMEAADYTIGLFGLGSDGHTAGIKPGSSAVTATAWAEHFVGEDFERITMTPFAVSQVDEIVVQASGDDKLPMLRRLLYETLDATEQPAQILKTVAKCTLYTDNEEV